MEVRFTSEEARARWEATHREDLFDATEIDEGPRADREEQVELHAYGYDAW